MGQPSGEVPCGLSTTICASVSPATPKWSAALSASAAMSYCCEEAGAGAALSTQLPPSTGPLNVGPVPEESVYCEVMADQVSWLVPRPWKSLVR